MYVKLWTFEAIYGKVRFAVLGLLFLWKEIQYGKGFEGKGAGSRDFPRKERVIPIRCQKIFTDMGDRNYRSSTIAQTRIALFNMFEIAKDNDLIMTKRLVF